MLRITTALAMILTFTSASAQGTADEAKAMLMKAVAAVKADKDKTLDIINKGEGGFLDRDLYVLCDTLSDGKQVATASNNAKQLTGTDIRGLKDVTGKVIGQPILDGMKKPEGEITEVSYMWPRPGPDKTPVQKTGIVTRVSDDMGCGVGYYK